MVDHMTVKTGSFKHYIYGTTRTRYKDGAGTGTEQNIYFFRLETVSVADDSLMTSAAEVKVKKLETSNSALSAGSYVAGITAPDAIHAVLFSASDNKVYYVRLAVGGAGTNASTVLLYENVAYVGETAFAGGGTSIDPTGWW